MPHIPQASSINPPGSNSPDAAHENPGYQPRGSTTSRADGPQPSDTAEGLKREGRAASEAFHDATDAVRRKASDFASEAAKGARQQAESMQGETSEALHAFAEAARGAGGRLKDQEHGIAARLVEEAAGGLDGIAHSLGNKPLDAIVHDVRAFGRRNPAAFMAASVLAGIALGRFLRSSASDDMNRGRQDRSMGAGESEKGAGR